MRFAQAARFGDTIDTFDGYTGRYLFKSQPAAFETSNPEGSTSKRRVMSVAPDITIPERRCLAFGGETWIVGDGSTDSFRNRPVRTSYWLRKGVELFTIRTPGQAAIGIAELASAYGMREYLKDTVDGQSSTNYYPQYETHFAKSEEIERGYFIESDSRIYRVRAVRDDPAGFWLISTDELDPGSRKFAFFLTTTYNPSTDTYDTISTNKQILLMERGRSYDLVTQADPTYQAGDKTMFVPKTSITPVTGQEITIDSVAWRIEQLGEEHDAWVAHLRRR